MLNRVISLALLAVMVLSLCAPAAYAEDSYVRTIKDSVNIRETPAGKVLNENSQIPLGSVLLVYGLESSSGHEWALIRYDGVTGYIDSDCYALSDVEGNLLSGAASASATAAGATLKKGDYGEVTTDNVFFRKTASTSGDFWDRLPKGWRLKVLGTTTTGKGKSAILWYKVQGGTTKWPDRTYTGYIHSDYFTAAGAATATPKPGATATPKPSSSDSGDGDTTSSGQYVRTVKTGVNIRKTPGGTVLTGKNEDKIPIGTVLAYNAGPTSANGYDWVRVSYRGITGYIRSDCWVFTDENGNGGSTVSPTAAPDVGDGLGTVTLTTGGVNFRETPGGMILGRLPKNTKMTYYNTRTVNGVLWYYVYSSAIGNYGYVLGSLAKVTSGSTVKPTVTATPKPGGGTSSVGTLTTIADKLNLRKTPSLQATVLVQIPKSGVNLSYSATETAGGVTWYKVTYNGKTGWLHGNFVRDNGGTTKATATPKPSTGYTTPVPSAAGLSDVALTTANRVFIRKSASMSAKQLGSVAKAGTRLTYLGKYAEDKTSKPGTTYVWYNVEYGKVTGWMRGDYLRVLTPDEKKVYLLTGDPNAPAEATYTTLKKGDEGDAVTALQQKLVEKGYLKQSDVTGKYTTATEKAVIAFQKDNKLTQDGIAGEKTQHALFGTVPVGTYDNSTVDPVLYPVEKVDWFTGDIQTVWAIGVNAVVTDVYTGISFRAQRLYGGNHADCEPLTTEDTTAYCQIYGVNNAQEISDRMSELQSWRRRPLWVTVGGRTFAASMYGVPHNYSGDRIADNNFNGQFCVHFVNSRTHETNRVDTDNSQNGNFGHQSAIQYAYTHSISGTK
ncbi:MAG: SH3 domain-containing protein [Clostridia bacterium]|nr:SH3 domain-containing protein [Clostridia bacterium]